MNKLPEPIQSDPAISFDSDSQFIFCYILLLLWYQWESHVVIILQRFTKEKQSTMNSSNTLNMYVLNWINKSSSDVGSSMFDCSKLKIGCSSLITYRWTCSSSFDVRKMILEFVRCLIKWSLNHHYQTLLWNWKDCLNLERCTWLKLHWFW